MYKAGMAVDRTNPPQSLFIFLIILLSILYLYEDNRPSHITCVCLQDEPNLYFFLSCIKFQSLFHVYHPIKDNLVVFRCFITRDEIANHEKQEHSCEELHSGFPK